jgi:hypothetical protein
MYNNFSHEKFTSATRTGSDQFSYSTKLVLEEIWPNGNPNMPHTLKPFSKE